MSLQQQALAIHQELGDRPNEARTLSDIGNVLADQDQPELAIVFYKQAINVWEAIRHDNQGLPKDQQESFADAIADDYRELADLLLQQDRVLEAQAVLDLLKIQELDDYLRGVRGNATTPSGVEFWQSEQEILNQFNAQQQSAIELGKELIALREIPEGDRTPTQQQRIDELVNLEEDLNGQFNAFLDLTFPAKS